MRRFLWAPLLFVLALAACSPGGSGFSCNNDICIHLEIAEPVKALEPSLVTATIRTGPDISKLVVNLNGDYAGIMGGPLKMPESAKVSRQEERDISWHIDTKSGETYTFSAYILIDQPSASYGVFSYHLLARANDATGRIARDSVDVYLDAAGNQLDADKAREMPTYPLPTLAFTFVPKPTATMTPTAALPTMTPSPTATLPPTMAEPPLRSSPYPGPE